MTKTQRDEVTAFLFYLQHADDAEYQHQIETRLADRDPAHWLTLEEFERSLDRLAVYGLTQGGLMPVPTIVERIVPPGKEARFMAVWFAHMTSYLVGASGGAFVCCRAWNARGRPAAIALLPRSRAATVRTGVIVLIGFAVWWWRGRAR